MYDLRPKIISDTFLLVPTFSIKSLVAVHFDIAANSQN